MFKLSCIAFIAVTAATYAQIARPAIRTTDGAIVIESANGAKLTLTNSDAQPCPTNEPTVATTESPTPQPTSKGGSFSSLGNGGGGGGSSVGWVEVIPQKIPAHTIDTTVKVVGSCVGSAQCGAFLSNTQRQLQCEYLDENGDSVAVVYGKSTSTGTVSSLLFNLECVIPKIFDVGTELTVQILFNGEKIPFLGADDAQKATFTTQVDGALEYSGGRNVTLTGFGFKVDGYFCSVDDKTLPTSTVTNTAVVCDISGVSTPRRYNDIDITLYTKIGGDKVPMQHTQTWIEDSDGVYVPETKYEYSIEIDSCNDTVRNNGETDIDCGGQYCPSCVLGDGCSQNSDCIGDLYCDTKKTCADPDRDNDGFSKSQGDCDDTNPKINPKAEEIADGLDNNCDGKYMDGDWSTNFVFGSRTVYEFGSFNVSRGHTVNIQTVGPLTIFVGGNMEMAGNIVLNGGKGQNSERAYSYRTSQGGRSAKTASNRHGGTAPSGWVGACSGAASGIGPGRGCSGHPGGYGGGGAGAGHASVGGIGNRGNGGNSIQGGSKYGSDTTPQLNPGSGGGAGAYGSANNQAGAAGGGAGGAVKIDAQGTLIMSGTISVNGGDGGGGAGCCGGDAGAGGGGSGGTIWLRSPNLIVPGTMSAQGGAGGRPDDIGGRGGAGSPGRIWLQGKNKPTPGTANPAVKYADY